MPKEVVDFEGVEVSLPELDLPALGLPLQLLEVVGALGLAHEVERLPPVLVANEGPVGVVVAEWGGDLEPLRELNEQRNVRTALEELRKLLLDPRVADDLVRDALCHRHGDGC